MLYAQQMPTPAQGQQLPELCAQNNGRWLEKYKECEYACREWCATAGGHFDECGSACRHEPNPGPCTMQCVPVCKFATHMIGKDAANSEYVIDGNSVVLKEGKTEKQAAPGSATIATIRILDATTTGDLNGDGRDDVVVLLVQNAGGSGSFLRISESVMFSDVARHFLQLGQLPAGIPGAEQVKQSFELPTGVKYGDYVKSLDAFCADYRNLGIPVPNGLGVVSAALAGRSTLDDKGLQFYRCIAAAGDDKNKANLEWWTDPIRKPQAYKAMAMPATAFEKVSAHGLRTARNSRLGWVACCSGSAICQVFRHSSFFRSSRISPSSIPVIVPMAVTGSPSWTLLNRGYFSSSTSTYITAPALLSPWRNMTSAMPGLV